MTLDELECKKAIIRLIIDGANKPQVRTTLVERLVASGYCLDLAAAFVEQQLNNITRNVIL